MQVCCVREIYPSLCEKLVAKKVAVEMFQRDALTCTEMESIHAQKEPHKASEELLDVLLRLPEDATTAFDCFLETLKITNQQHILLWIKYPGKSQEMSSLFVRLQILI
jgi:Caspase recruitment domain